MSALNCREPIQSILLHSGRLSIVTRKAKAEIEQAPASPVRLSMGRDSRASALGKNTVLGTTLQKRIRVLYNFYSPMPKTGRHAIRTTLLVNPSTLLSKGFSTSKTSGSEQADWAKLHESWCGFG